MASRIFTLFASSLILLSGCAARQLNPITFQTGGNYCESSLGQFTVSLVPSTTSAGTYDLQIVATQVNKPGQYVEIALTNGNPQQALTLTNGTVLVENQILLEQPLTPEELSIYPEAAIALSDGSATPFPNLPAGSYAMCQIPQANLSVPQY